MTRFAAVLAVLAFSLGGLVRADEKEKDKDKDAKELEGSYKILSAERDGKLAEKALTDLMTVTFKGDEFVLTSGDDKKVAKFKATPDAKLATIDFSPLSGEDKGKTIPGIYKLEKGELLIAMNEKEKAERPKEFKSDSGVMLLRLKKVEK
jgi:uncharacterized protein (TIGR03067 family)